MASNKIIRSGPIALTTTTTTNLLNPPTLAGGAGLAGVNADTYLVLTHVRIVNKTNAAISCALWLGATGGNAGGTECIAGGAATGGALNVGTGVSVPANGYFDWYGKLRLGVADFLVGGASAAGLTLTADGEIGIV